MTVLDVIEKTLDEQIPEEVKSWISNEELAFYILRDMLDKGYVPVDL